MTRTFAIIALAAALGATSTAAQAQLGIKGGFSYGDVSNRGVLPGDLDARSGFAIGLTASTTWNVIGIGIEALYAQRGVQNGSAAESRELDFLDVPAYLRVALPMGGVSPFAYAGPQISFELRCHAGSTECPDVDLENRDHFSYAGVIGAGIRLGGRTGLSIEGRYIYGLKDLKLSTVTASESYKDRSFLILGGITF